MSAAAKWRETNVNRFENGMGIKKLRCPARQEKKREVELKKKNYIG